MKYLNYMPLEETWSILTLLKILLKRRIIIIMIFESENHIFFSGIRRAETETNVLMRNDA